MTAAPDASPTVLPYRRFAFDGRISFGRGIRFRELAARLFRIDHYLTCRGASLESSVLVTTSITTIREVDLDARKTSVYNDGTGRVDIYEDGVIVARLQGGESRKLPANGRLRISGRSLTGANTVRCVTHEYCPPIGGRTVTTTGSGHDPTLEAPELIGKSLASNRLKKGHAGYLDADTKFLRRVRIDILQNNDFPLDKINVTTVWTYDKSTGDESSPTYSGSAFDADGIPIALSAASGILEDVVPESNIFGAIYQAATEAVPSEGYAWEFLLDEYTTAELESDVEAILQQPPVDLPASLMSPDDLTVPHRWLSGDSIRFSAGWLTYRWRFKPTESGKYQIKWTERRLPLETPDALPQLVSFDPTDPLYDDDAMEWTWDGVIPGGYAAGNPATWPVSPAFVIKPPQKNKTAIVLVGVTFNSNPSDA